MKTVALLLAFCALSGLTRAAPIMRAVWTVAQVASYPRASMMAEKAITEPRAFGMMLRGIDPALQFIRAVGRAAHPGELIGGLNTLKKALQSNDPIVAADALKSIRRIRNELAPPVTRHGHLKFKEAVNTAAAV